MSATNLTEKAYAKIKERLIRLELRPGSMISEASLAADLGISKTPVREALARLRREGLVIPQPRAGYSVSPVTLKDVRELFELRAMLEGEAAARAATRSADPEELDRLDKLCQFGFDPKDVDSISQFLEANRRFHVGVARASGNDRLAEMLEQLMDSMNRAFHLSLALSGRKTEVVHQHQDLVRAVAEGDSEKARAVAIAQVLESQAATMDTFMSSPSLVSASIAPPSS